ncbi:MAG: HAD family hydrolase [Clostridia bacterium]|nr:HAD family hydrolase [Clostridia bacterium]
MQKTVFFDLDGTVLDTLPDLAKSANYALKELGYPTQSLESVRMAIGHGIRNLLRELMHCTDEQELEKCREIFKDYYDAHKADTTKPFDGILNMLQDLKNRGYKLVLISNKYDGATKDLAMRFFGDLFDGVYGSRDDIPAKPDRDLFQIACKEHGVSQDGIIYVGDSEVDCEFARNCGMTLIAVNWGFRTQDQLIQAGADIIVSSPIELYNTVIRIAEEFI